MPNVFRKITLVVITIGAERGRAARGDPSALFKPESPQI
jgi:hypothetical protein